VAETKIKNRRKRNCQKSTMEAVTEVIQVMQNERDARSTENYEVAGSEVN